MQAQARNARETAPAQYRVMRSFKGADGRMLEPGEVIEVDASWPWHRAQDLTTQRYLLPLAPAPRRGKE